jgi:hypothetical protein
LKNTEHTGDKEHKLLGNVDVTRMPLMKIIQTVQDVPYEDNADGTGGTLLENAEWYTPTIVIPVVTFS